MPKRVILIAAVTIDGYIARHSLETIRWSQDLPLFKEQTMGWPVIMGSKTHRALSDELVGRKTIIVHRNDDPESILKKISAYQCFVIGGGRTYLNFIKNITHVYVTPHPHIFGDGVALFYEKHNTELKLKFIKLVEVDPEKGIFQYQYKVDHIF